MFLLQLARYISLFRGWENGEYIENTDQSSRGMSGQRIGPKRHRSIGWIRCNYTLYNIMYEWRRGHPAVYEGWAADNNNKKTGYFRRLP